MISVHRPSSELVEEYRAARIAAAPTCATAAETPAGFRHDSFSRIVGSSPGDYERARLGIERWAAHRGSGVEVFPSDATVVEGATVVVLTRQLGLWVLGACRIESVIDEPERFGFVYTTLPDHPECGYESFVISVSDSEVTFDIEATSRPGIPLVRIAAPVTKVLQRRATNAYLTAMETWVQAG